MSALVALTGCGDGPSASGESGADTLKVAYVSENSLVYLAIQEGNKLGAWKGSGITVEPVSTNDAAAAQLLAGGNIDIVAQVAAREADSIRKGVDASIIGGIRTGGLQFLFATKKSAATSIDDLEGGTFGVTGYGSPGHYSTVKVASEQGWSEDDYKVVALGGIAELQAAVDRGSIDAFWWSAPVAYTLQDQGLGTVLGAVSDYGDDPGLVSFAATNELVAKRAEAVKAFLDGYYATIKRIKEDPSIARDIMTNDWDQPAIAADAALDAELGQMLTSDGISKDVLADVPDVANFTDPDAKITVADVDSYYRPLE